MATADNLKIAQQLLATMQQITAQVEKQTEAYHAQAQLVDALCKAQECFGKVDSSKVKEVTEALEKAREKTKEFGIETEEVEKQIGLLQKGVNKVVDWVRKLSVPAEFVNGFKAGLNVATNLFKNIMSLGGTAFGLLKDIGGIFLSLPGRVLDFFEGAAGSGIDPYRQALEEVRKEFGNLEVGTSAAIKGMTESMHGLGNVGVSTARIFGYGREGLATLLRENLELAKGMGPIFRRFAADVAGSAREVTILRKSTNLSADAFKSLQISAENGGETTTKRIKGLIKAIAQTEMTFGISAKEIGKDLDFMMKETATFGIMAPQAMLKTSVYVKKLGISMEALKGIMEKTLNFEDTAQQVARLSEAFNVQIDAVKLMNEQDPTKKMDMYRQAFFKTGQNIETMTVAQKKYWADTTGMTEETMRLAFAQKNRALSGAALDAQMKKSQKQQITQQEAMTRLAKSIERLTQSGSAMKGSFFDIFFNGFNRGVKLSKEFRDVVRNLQQTLRTVYLAGMQVGRLFVQNFPGVKGMLKALADMFSPARFRPFMKNVVEEFKKFFQLIKTDPKAGVEQFMKNMKKLFFDFFNKGSPAGSRFIDGLKQFYKTVAEIFAAGLRYAIKAVADGMRTLADIIVNPREYFQKLSSGTAGSRSAVQELLLPIWEAIRDSWPYLKESFLKLWDAAWPQIKHGLWVALKAVGPYILAIIFAPALFRAGAAAFAQGLVGMFSGGITQALPGISGLLKSFSSSLSGTVPEGMQQQGSRVGEAIQGAGDVADAANETSEINWGNVVKTLILATGVIWVLSRYVLPKLIELGNQIKDPMGVVAAAAALAITAVAVAQISEAVAAMIDAVEDVSWSQIGKASVGLLIVFAAATVIAFGAYGLSKLFENVKLEGIGKAALALGMAVSFLVGVSAIVLIAIGIGMLAAGTFGASLGIMLGGMAILAVAAFAVVETTLAIMRVIDRFKPAPGFKEKSDAFVNILKGITSFATVFVAISSATASSSLWDFFTGNQAERQQRTLNSLKELISTMGQQLTSIVREIITAVQGLQGTEAQIKSAEIIGNILGAVGNLAKALQPPSEALQQPGIVDQLLGNPSSVSDNIEHLARYTTTVTTAVRGFLTQITEILRSDTVSRGMSETQQRAATVFVSMLSGVGEFIKTITPTRALIEGVNGSRDFSGALINISDFMRDNLRTITNSDIFNTIGNIVTTIVNSTNNLSDRQAERLKGIIPIIEPLMKSIVAITTVIASLSIPGAGPAASNAAALFQLNQVIGTLFDRLKDDLPYLVGNMRSAFAGLTTKEANSFAKGIEGVSTIFQVVASIPNMLNSLKGLSTGANATQLVGNDILVALDTMVQLFFGAHGRQGLITTMRQLIVGFIPITAAILNPTDFANKINTIKTIFDVLGGIPAMITGFKSLAGTSTTGELATDVMARPLLNLKRVIDSLSSPYLNNTDRNPLLDPKLWMKLTDVQTNMKGKPALLDRVKQQLTTVFTAAQDIISLPDIQAARVDAMITSLVNIDDMIARLHGFLGTSDSATSRWDISLRDMTDNIRDNLIADVHDMVGAYNSFARELAHFGTGGRPLQVTLDNLGARLGGRQRLAVQNAAVNAVINVQVTMEVGDVIAAMSTHSQRQNQAPPASNTRPAFTNESFTSNTLASTVP